MKALQSIGLTQKEAEIYKALLQLGNVPMARVMAATGSHPQVVYSTIDKLERKKLAITTTQRNRRYVRPEPPQALADMEKQKLVEIEKALPALEALQKTPADALIRVARGGEAVRALRMRAVAELPAGGTHYVIGGSGTRYYEVMGEKGLKEFERKRVRKRIWFKLIAFQSQKELVEENRTESKFTEFRYLPEEFDVFTSTTIFNDTTAIIIWARDPIIITIESAEVAESYKQYFATLWRIARE